MTDKTVRFITAWDGRKPGDFVYRNSGSQAEPIWTKLADGA